MEPLGGSEGPAWTLPASHLCRNQATGLRKRATAGQGQATPQHCTCSEVLTQGPPGTGH